MTAVAPTGGPSGVPEPNEAARQVFGANLPTAVRYAEFLAGEGVEHGHLGPREVTRLWSRHLVNCAVVTDLIPMGARVVDIGSGAGLPGLPIAIRRGDVQVVLIEPMLRRSQFLHRAVDALGLAERVTVVRGRAEDRAVRRDVGESGVVTARAVAPLDRLLGWGLPLVAVGGEMLALKGSTATEEVRALGALPRALRDQLASTEVVNVGEAFEGAATHVVRVVRAPACSGSRNRGRAQRA